MCTLHGCVDTQTTPKPIVDNDMRRAFVKYNINKSLNFYCKIKH